MPENKSLPTCFLEAMERHANPRAQMFRDASAWQSISAREMLRRVAGLSVALASMGFRAGDRVAVFAPNCPEWHIADFAIQGLGGVTVPVYFNESEERLIYILNDSGARIVFTKGEAQAQKIEACRRRVPSLEKVIAAGPAGVGDFVGFINLIHATGESAIAEYKRRAAEVRSDQLATIIYTSGTTGEPKGVMLSHSNMTSNAVDSLASYDFRPDDIALSFLPLAHVYERTMDYGYMFRGVSVAYLEKMETVAEALLEVHPTITAAVPRFFEKVYANIVEKGHHESGLKRKIFDWALHVAAEAAPWRAYGKDASGSLRLKWRIADAIVYSKIREGVGGRIRSFCSGGAPLAPELAEFFWSVNLPAYQGYGLTETSPIVAANLPVANKVGTVGRPIPHVEVKTADDGEVLVKGACVMQGYYNKPDETRTVFTSDGWFCTGDIGKLDADGYLSITDRKKELLKTAGGKFVAPAPIENLLKTSHFISNAMVVGEKRKFVSVLLVPDFAAIDTEAHKAGREFSSPAQMANDDWVRDLLSREIERLTAPLAQYEKPKRFALLDRDFAYAKDELTYTLKLKRRVIEQHYADVVARLYADVEEPRPQHMA
ncbi:MAG TPA: long-chain fatty acid--CoA ligase [Candidatus Acidoferrales bacterium]|jgi:long-chain acyl-CoA synthetase|nr:long-chain fatty acid--CoA ligase [Candidatus Acidoferrales bacterium]